MKLLYHIFENAASLIYGNKCGSISSAISDNATPFDSVFPDDVSDVRTYCENSVNSNLEVESTINLDSLGRANL
jgi:hypothetical protein